MLWKPNRHPDRYPARWHDVFKCAPGEYLLGVYETERAAENARIKFSSFRASLRSHADNPTARLAEKRKTRMRVQEVSETEWALWVTVQWELREILERVISSPPGQT